MTGLFLRTETEDWWHTVHDQHYEEALSRANSLLADTVETEGGCLLTATETPRKLRFRGRQVRAYCFVHHVATQTIPGVDDVVRHRCHERRCINPQHLTIGSRADNKRDDWEHWANGTDLQLL